MVTPEGRGNALGDEVTMEVPEDTGLVVEATVLLLSRTNCGV